MRGKWNKNLFFFFLQLIKIVLVGRKIKRCTSCILRGGRASEAGNVRLWRHRFSASCPPFFLGTDVLKLWQERRRCNPSTKGVMFSKHLHHHHHHPYRWLITLNSKTYRRIRNINIFFFFPADWRWPCRFPVFAMCAQRALTVNLRGRLCGQAIMDLLSWPWSVCGWLCD